MRVNVHVRGVASVSRWLSLLPADMRIAQARAIRDTLRHAKTLIKRDAAKELRVPQKALKNRIITEKISNKDTEGRLWGGVWDINPMVFGRATQGKSGVIGIPGRRYVGAFLGAVYGGVDSIWIRKRSKHFDPKLYPTKRRKSLGDVPASLGNRFPVVKAGIDIEAGMERVFDRDEKPIANHFKKRLEAQVKYQLLQAAK